MTVFALYFRENMWYRRSLLQCELLPFSWDWLPNQHSTCCTVLSL